MTYLDLIRDADRKLDKGHITLGEYEQMIEPLKREIQPTAQPDPHWIPCRKKLPEKVGAYLVKALMNGDIFVARWEGCYWGVKTPIIAWMPLPEPYRGGDSE